VRVKVRLLENFNRNGQFKFDFDSLNQRIRVGLFEEMRNRINENETEGALKIVIQDHYKTAQRQTAKSQSAKATA